VAVLASPSCLTPLVKALSGVVPLVEARVRAAVQLLKRTLYFDLYVVNSILHKSLNHIEYF